ncbi:MAG: amidase [Nocardioides sp.]|uniref:amidase n=1 Tax=Nocardioides sp. TaxID=35761 RepID=UPI0039E4512B
MPRVHAFTDDALGRLDAVGVAEALSRRDVSATEVIEAAIARVELVDAELGAVAYRTFDRARREAAGPRTGFFAGVPTLIKDNVDVAGVPTRHGTDAYVASAARRNGELTAMLMKLGLISLGKSQLSEFGFSATAEHPRLGPVRSPWETELPAGASSAGAAALVAAGAVPIAHGNDGGGSLRIPASVTGLVGLKPTRGRVAQDAYYTLLPLRIVADGVLTRSVRDAAAFLREAEKVHRDLALPPVGAVSGPGRRLRIAVCTEVLDRRASPEVADLTMRTASLLAELGHHVDRVAPPVPPTLPDDFILYWGSLALTVANSGPLRGRTWDRSRLDNLTRGLADHTARHLRHLPGAILRLRRVAEIARGFHEAYDVLLTPTVAHETQPLGYLAPDQEFAVVFERLLGWVAFTPWANVTGGPAISLPLATTASGRPQGMMFGAASGQEATLLELAYELEAARPFPSLADDPGR